MREPENLLRGLVVGAGIGLALRAELPLANAYQRCGFGLLVGAAAYTGVDLLRDAAAIARGRRRRLQAPRVYALGALLGGAVGGALGWYFEASQLHVVIEKFTLYAAIDRPVAGAAGSYVIYPLFSKWGAIDLGEVTGGVKLFFVESLSGVIGWSLAAPLFSFNLVLLTALLQRSAAPLRSLFTAGGLVGVGEQALRVQRWGLWMAPVIYSFLRLSPDPTWYDQDGAVRSVVAALHALLLEPGDFRRWSLEVFLGLLAYDWLRIARVVRSHGPARRDARESLLHRRRSARRGRRALHRTLGAHAGDSGGDPALCDLGSAADPLLHPARRRMGPGLERSRAGARRGRRALGAGGRRAGGLRDRRRRARRSRWRSRCCAQRRRDARPAQALRARAAPARDERFTLGNGTYSLELSREGIGYSRVVSSAHGGGEIDLTRRPEDPLSLRGKLFYLREADPRRRGR